MQFKQLRGFELGLAALTVGGLLLATPAAAVPVYGTSAQGELTGSRSTDGGGGLTGFGSWSSGFTVDWEIEQIPSSILWSYKYTFTGLSSKDVSHLVVDLSDDCFGLEEEEIVLTDADCVTDAKLTIPQEGDDPIMIVLMTGSTIESNCGPDEDMPCVDFGEGGSQDGITGSVKFDEGGGEGTMYEFVSNRAPVYGHLAVKDGGGPGTCPSPGGTTAACSNGLVAGSDTMDTNDYVPRPNGIVPEPGTMLLLGGGLGGLAFLGRGRRT